LKPRFTNWTFTQIVPGFPRFLINFLTFLFYVFTMSLNLTTRAGKGEPLTANDHDGNLSKIESAIWDTGNTSLSGYTAFPPGTNYYVETDIVSLGTGMWAGGVLAPNGKLYGIPGVAESVLIYDPITREYDADSIPVPPGGSKWAGGILAKDGKIYCAPDSQSQRNVLVIDPKTDTVELRPFEADGRWAGAVEAPDGKIYCIPSQGDLAANNRMNILVIDPSTGSISFIETPLEGADGDNDELYGGVLAPNGKIYCAPRNCSQILVVDVYAAEPVVSTIPKPLDAGSNQWSFGCLGSDSCVYFAPRSATKILKVDPATDTVTTVGDLSPQVNNRTFSATLAPDNKIYFNRWVGASVYWTYDLETGLAQSQPLNPVALVNNEAAKWTLCPNGELVGLPFNGTRIMHIRTSLPKLPDWMMGRWFNRL
jgi:streptogramin lyase